MKPFLIAASACLVVLTSQCAPSPAAPLKYTTTWIGNSVAGPDHFAPDTIGLWVLPNGTCITTARYGVGAISKDGTIVSHLHTAVQASSLVSANSHYCFLTSPIPGTLTFGIRRLALDGTTTPYHAAPGEGDDGSFLPVGVHGASGIAANDVALYASNPDEGVVQAFEPSSMAPTRSFPVDHPGLLAVDGVGQIWVEEKGADGLTERIACYDPSGILQPRQIAFPQPTRITAMVCDDDRNRLLVADDGPDQDVKVYDLGRVTDKPIDPFRTIGRLGGLRAPRDGEAAPRKFDHPVGIGIDNVGNVYVLSSGTDNAPCATLESLRFMSERANWLLSAQIDKEPIDADPLLPGDLYSRDKHFRFDYTKPAGAESVLNGVTLDPVRYSLDPRVVLDASHVGVWTEHRNAQSYLYVGSVAGNWIAAYRFEKLNTENAIPALIFAREAPGDSVWPPSKPLPAITDAGHWTVWRTTGNGKYSIAGQRHPLLDAAGAGVLSVDESGGLWFAGGSKLVRVLAQDFSSGKMIATARTSPTALSKVRSLVYDPTTDTMYVAGTTPTGTQMSGLGDFLGRYDTWSQSQGNLRCLIPLPKGSAAKPQVPESFAVAGDYVFVAYHTYDSRSLVKVYDSTTGAFAGDLVPGIETNHAGGDSTSPDSIHAHLLPSGEYMVTVEDDRDANVIAYRWTPDTTHQSR